MVAQIGGGGPGSGQNPYASFLSLQSANQAAASSISAASVASVESAASVASAVQASSVAAATTTDSGNTISTSIPLGTSTTANLTPSSTAAVATPTSTLQSTSGASAVLASSSVQSTPSTAAFTSSTGPLSPSTFSTSTKPAGLVSSSSTYSSASSLHASPSATSTSAGSAASETQNPLPLTGNAHHYGMSHGALAAAVVVPILLALLVIILAFLCLRRKSNRNRERSHSGIAFLPAMREKFSSNRGSSAYAAPAPVVTSNRNNAYFTGLDTSSQGSRRGESGEYYAPPRRSEGGTTFEDPPPPYKAKSLSTNGSGGGSLNRTSIPEVPEPAAVATAPLIPTVRKPHHETERSPFADPSPNSSPSNLDNNFLVSPVERPQTSRSISQRSFNSDQYSETASVHSVRVARLSVGGMLGGPHVVDANPFGDRHSVESPRVSQEDESYRMIAGRRRSDVSAISR